MVFKIVSFLFYLKYVSCTLSHYKASVVDLSKTDVDMDKYESLILEAAAANVDLLLLSPSKIGAETLDSCVNNPDNYDEVVKVISKAAKTGGIYVVAQVYKKGRCHHQEATYNNMVFDRDGRIVVAYRTPATAHSECNETESKIVKFNTDFDVTFALVKEEDIALHRIGYFDGIKNFIISEVTADIPNLFAEQFTSSWSFVNKVNVISPSGIFGGKTYSLDNLLIADFQKSGGSSPLLTTSSSQQGLHHLYLNIKPLNMVTQGYTETVCDGSFCCNFYVKTSDIDSSVRYALSAHSDMVQLGYHKVAVQVCGVSSKLQTDIKFDKIIITANFTKDSAQFPSVTTIEPTIINNLIQTHNSVELYDTNVLTFGVMSRDYTSDNIIELQNKTDTQTEYISYENINDCFDYVWIRVRVLIFIVSIYILEML